MRLLIEFRCQSCSKPKETLHNVESSLIKGVKLIMCKTCIDGKFEPRAFVIISIDQYGVTKEAKKIIMERRYYGDTIEATDVIVNL